MGAGGHNPFFGADDLSGRQLMAPGAVGSEARWRFGTALWRLTPLSNTAVNYYTTFRPPFPLFFCTARAVRARKASHMAQAAAAERVSAFWKSSWAMASVCSAR